MRAVPMGWPADVFGRDAKRKLAFTSIRMFLAVHAHTRVRPQPWQGIHRTAHSISRSIRICRCFALPWQTTVCGFAPNLVLIWKWNQVLRLGSSARSGWRWQRLRHRARPWRAHRACVCGRRKPGARGRWTRRRRISDGTPGHAARFAQPIRAIAGSDALPVPNPAWP